MSTIAGRGWRRRARHAALALALALPAPIAAAAEMDGVTLPDTLRVGSHELRLNGLTVRNYSIFNVSIYVMGLYVEQPVHDAASLLASRGDKALVFHFVRDVDVEHVRDAWHEGFEDNCAKPCAVPEANIERFLQSVFGVKSGDVSMLAFSGGHFEATLNGRPAGSFDDAPMANLILTSFFGPRPPEQRMKRELLGLR